jgi:hypothetical protein
LFVAPLTRAGELQTMTLNQYLGADLTPVLQAAQTGDPEAFNIAIIAALGQIADNRPVERMQAQGALIADRGPALAGLQESYAFSCSDPFGTGGCDNSSIAGAFVDYLDATLTALNGSYQQAAFVINFDATDIPVFLAGAFAPIFISVTDRDVILARSDIATAPVDFGCPGYVSADGCNYMVVANAGPFAVQRGFVGVDATVDGNDYRVVNTHLEVKEPPVPPIFQILQAQELIATLAATPFDRRLVVLGDINSGPQDALPLPYGQFLAFGFTDVWLLRPGGLPGATCCQREDLANRQSALDDRIDMIFTLDPPSRARKVRVLGDVVSTRTRPPGIGLWASDHASVAAGLEF